MRGFLGFLIFLFLGLQALFAAADIGCLAGLTRVALSDEDLSGFASTYSDGRPTIVRHPFHTLDDQTIRDLEIDKTVFPVIDRTITRLGSARLRWDLTHPMTDPVAIRNKQAAVKEIIKNPKLRASIESMLQDLKPMMDDFKSHYNYVTSGSMRQHLLVPILSMGLWTAGIGVSSYLFEGDLIKILKLSGLLSFAPLLMSNTPLSVNQRMNTWGLRPPFKSAKKISREILKASSTDLQEIGKIISLVETDPILKEMARRLRVLAYSPLTFPINLVSGQGIALAWSAARQLKSHFAHFTALLSAYAELDALLSRAKLADEPEYKFPEILDGEEAELEITDGHLPFELKNKGSLSIPNSIRLSAKTNPNFAIVAGPNKGGKSTFLRMILTLADMGQAAFPVPVKDMRYTPVEIYSSMKTSDDQENGKSGYDNETDRAFQLVQIAEAAHRENRKILIGFDEIYRGTNGDEKEAAVRGTILHLAELGNLYLIAPHDERVVDLVNETPRIAVFHVEYELKDGQLIFPRKILPGPPTQRDGILLLEAKGFPRAITERARDYLRRKNIAQDRTPGQ